MGKWEKYIYYINIIIFFITHKKPIFPFFPSLPKLKHWEMGKIRPVFPIHSLTFFGR